MASRPDEPTTPTTPLLDHVVILVPHAFVASPPAWLREAFTVSQGGRHADGRTENVLVLFDDGAYLEFIAFVPGLDPDARRRHRWGREAEGSIIDWALTLPPPEGGAEVIPEAAFAAVRDRVARAGTPLRYGGPVAGGRTRPDGVVLRWATAAAYRSAAADEEPVPPGRLPFWCLDDTPRARRVPYQQGDGATAHPCGALGPAVVEQAPDGEAADLEAVYGALLGERLLGAEPSWPLRTPAGRPGHRVAKVKLNGEEGAPGSLRLCLFTDKSEFDGRSVGGEVAERMNLAFDLIYTGSSSETAE